MPKVTRVGHGFIIRSFWRGKHITHQVDAAGEKYLHDRFGFVEGIEIDISTLLELKRRGHAFTRRQKRENRRRQRDHTQEGLFSEPQVPRSVQPPASSLMDAPAYSCLACRGQVSAGAQFCQRCGHKVVTAEASADHTWIFGVAAGLVAVAWFLIALMKR
jgi:hypothetical protein